MGIPSQFFFATSPKHPWMLQTLNDGINVLSKSRFVMRNMPAQSTVPHAYKMGFIYFQKGVGIETNDYVPHGIYEGALDNKTMQDFVDAGIILVGECDGEPSSGHWRCIRLVGNKTQSREFVNRKGAAGYGSSLETLGTTMVTRRQRKSPVRTTSNSRKNGSRD
mmetsp:Transcript_10015/g.29584  ORF Transcript_10015/g.29584 Transcript_10015/m.29584 type:complete len:164 (-) Transcript_10015:262-753(-)